MGRSPARLRACAGRLVLTRRRYRPGSRLQAAGGEGWPAAVLRQAYGRAARRGVTGRRDGERPMIFNREGYDR